MKKRLLFAVSLLCLFVVSVLVHTPAQALFYFKSTLPDTLHISGVSGSVWHGKAMDVEWQSQTKRVDLGSVVWRIHWTSLLTGKVKVTFRFGQHSQMQLSGRGQVVVSRSDIQIPALTVHFPVESLVPLIPSPVSFSAKGTGVVHLKNVVLNGLRCDAGQGSVQWNHAGLDVFSQSIDLGLTQSTLTCKNGNISAQINQKSDMLQSRLQGRFLMARRLELSGSVTPLEGVPPVLLDQLTRLPEADSGQGYQIRYQGLW
ncbi:type II secretion system protein N [Vibrio salinus]|uniref:type II secretion system protein N n=1 Tax=Vibrio salinus TaxID=2899784 RepID=UPI001E2AF5B1|nr:type II secretion system protein N [Vibrio salinus]MCE0493863.1 type II secretion system protein N [Vibrio salinus]